ncbi:MAG: helix-turn-helix domain-containing protein [Lachnospiraceae bacterium]|nr:helix-turn-helix domain-containing protein [Lachnospiraceae bacterium]
MTVKEIRIQTGMSQKEFAEYFEIPLRTLQEWEQERRTPPDYVLGMIQKILKLESH